MFPNQSFMRWYMELAMDWVSEHSLGIDLDLKFESDSSSAKSFANRKGLGKQRHVQTRFLWIQDMVAARVFKITKVHGEKNISDVLTKVTSGTLLKRHMQEMNFQFVDHSRKQKTVHL